VSEAAPANSTRPVPPPSPGELPRRVDKPWGHELIWAHTERYVGKLLVLETGKRLSFQYHEAKDEWIHVLEGRLLLTLENDGGVVEERELGPGEIAIAPAGMPHAFTNTGDGPLRQIDIHLSRSFQTEWL
jgi:mannose-6-phosphate isomerase-like protein (cupin superfamily)